MAINNNAININAGFELGSKQPLDSRQYLTKEQMLNINENIMPDAYFCICKNDGNIYTYNKNNEIDPETGKFRQVNSDVTKLQYIVMPEITEENKNDVIQYIGDDETEYNKGSWYAVEETVLYSYSDGNNTVYLKDSIPSLTSNVYTSTGELISDFEIVEVDTENFAFTGGDGTTYSLIDNSQKLYNWKELVGSELKNAIQSMNYSDGKVWIGNLEEYEELSSAIKENNSITFLIYDDDLNFSIINDELVGHDTTLSSAEIYSKFVLANTTALVNYYKKSETMTKAEILAMIGQTLTTKIVSALPTESISANTIYLLSNASDSYDQYMYISNSWTKIGTTDLNLEGYATTEQLEEKQDKLTFDNVPTENSENPVTSGGVYQEINSKLTTSNSIPVSPTNSTTLLYTGADGTYEQGGIYKWDGSVWTLKSASRNTVAQNTLDIAALQNAGVKTIWSGEASKGDSCVFSLAGYDTAYARTGGIWVQLIAGHGSGTNGRKKFTALYAGRDIANAAIYEQYYILDILGDGTIATCAWFDVGRMYADNATIAAQKAMECIQNNTPWSTPIYEGLTSVENDIPLYQIIGVKYYPLA